MTDIPSIPAYVPVSGVPAWARKWQPRTEDDKSALALYGEDTITGIVDVLPGFAPGMDRDVLAGLIRQLASQVLELRCRLDDAQPFTPKQTRDKLRDVAAQLREAAEAYDKLPGDAKGLMARLRSGASFDDWVRGLDHVWSEPRRLREEAASAERAARAVKVRRGSPTDDGLKHTIKQLCGIYEIVTGKQPARHWDFDRFYGHGHERDGGLFYKFGEAAIKPLFPDAGGAGTNLREGLSWYGSNREGFSWYRNTRENT